VPDAFAMPSKTSVAEGKPKGPLSVVRGSVLAWRWIIFIIGATGLPVMERSVRILAAQLRSLEILKLGGAFAK
jgi:hypothetical protein